MGTSFATAIGGSTIQQNGSTGLSKGRSHHHHHHHHHSRAAAVPERLSGFAAYPSSDGGAGAGAGAVGGQKGEETMPGKSSSFTNASRYGHTYADSAPLNSLREARPSTTYSLDNRPSSLVEPFGIATSSTILNGTAESNMAPLRHKHERFQLHSNGYNLPRAAVSDVLGSKTSRGAWITSGELLTSCLIPLPFIMSSFVLTRQSPHDNDGNNILTGVDGPADVKVTQRQLPYLSVSGVCCLTAATLALVGFLGETIGHRISSHERKSSIPEERGKLSQGLISMTTIPQIVGRILSVGLPFFAVSKLGGERVALIIMAVVATEIMSTNPRVQEVARPGGWKLVVTYRKWTVAALGISVLLDVLGLGGNYLPLQAASGYLALTVSVFMVPLPYTAKVSSSSTKLMSPLISTPRDTDLTVISGVLATIISFVVFIMSSRESQTLTLPLLLGGSLVPIASAASLLLVRAKNMASNRKLGLAVGFVFAIVFQEVLDSHVLVPLIPQAILAMLLWSSVYYDTRTTGSRSRSISDLSFRHTLSTSQTQPSRPYSRVTALLLSASENWPLLHSILIEKDSRRILYFMCLNFGFMMIQTFYALVTGSLGLLSDSIHMLFDCLALVVGLCAAVMSKWPPSSRFPYGFGKMDTLAGFANGVFLMLISVEIIYEAVERFFEGFQMQRIGELLTVSSLGLVVNLVGMLAFGHAHVHGGHDHGHSHGHSGHSQNHGHNHGHGHGHEHSHALAEKHNHEHNVMRSTPSPLPLGDKASPAINSVSQHHSHSHTHGNSCSHQHGDHLHGPAHHDHSHAQTHTHHGHHDHHHHDHSNENMHGIFLHVLADTMGSVAVVLSTILIHFTGWFGWDALASVIIAVLIFVAAVPLVRSCATRLLLAVPEATEFDLREALSGVSAMRGVSGVCAPKFWVAAGGGGGDEARVEGVMHVIAHRDADVHDVRTRTLEYLATKGMDVLVQVEREGESRCWCGGGIARTS